MREDVELIIAWRNGDSQALQKLAGKYMSFALEKAKGFVSSPVEYDDIVQEAMLAFLSACCSFNTEGEASFKTYVSVCMNNRIISVINSLGRKKRIPRDALVSLEEIETPDGNNPEDLFFSRQKEEELIRLIEEELSEREKKVLSLFISGKKYDEIASVLDITPKSVDNTIQRIRKKLRRA